MSFLKNIGLLLIVLVLSYFTAPYFGAIYAKLAPGELDGGWIGDQDSWRFIAGVPLGFIFFTILFFKLFALGNKNKWIGWLLVLPVIILGMGNIVFLYIPIILGLISFGLATLIQKLFKPKI